MIRSTTNKPIIINLDGPEGNAFVLLGYADSYCKQLGLDKESILKEMTSNNYEALIQAFEKYFGKYVILETNNKNLLDALNVKTFKL